MISGDALFATSSPPRTGMRGNGPDLGNRFFDSVLQAIREAREHPQRFPEVRRGVRGVGCVGFPYRVYYEVRSDKIIVRAVYDLSRDPASWDDPDRD